jgi:hypothetical protein
MLYRKSIQSKEAFKNNAFKLFTEAVGFDLDEFTDIVYQRFVVEDLQYADDMYYWGVLGYFQKVVIPHKIAVYQAGLEITRQEWFKDFYVNKEQFLDNLIIHDISKFSANESFGYASYDFKNPKPSGGIKRAFESAWHHHKMHNEHHPEYWLNPNRSGELEVQEMPKIYVFEMVADWIGAGKTYGNSLESWLPGNYPKFKFHPNTDILLGSILGKMGINIKRQ